jgi:hypothetical protein
MIRMIRTKNLRALQEGAELASVLEADLENAEAAVAAFQADQADDMKQLQKQVTEVSDLRVALVAAESRNTDMHRLVELLLAATKYAFDAADSPVHVVLHEGRVRSAHRDGTSARAATPYPDSNWVTSQRPDPDPLGWKIQQAPLPQLSAPESAKEIEALLERLERPATDRPAEADRLQELTAELETVRSQCDTAITDCAALGKAYTSRCVELSLHRKDVTAAAELIAAVLSEQDPVRAVQKVSAVLLQYADVLGLDLHHGSALGAVRTTETKEVTA